MDRQSFRSSSGDPFVALLERLISMEGGVQQLARRSGVGQRTLEQWLKGDYPTVRVSAAIRALDDWGAKNVKGYPRRGDGSTLQELSAKAGREQGTSSTRQISDPPGQGGLQVAAASTDIEGSGPDVAQATTVDGLTPHAGINPSVVRLVVVADSHAGDRTRNSRAFTIVAVTATVAVAVAVAVAVLLFLQPDEEITVRGTVRCTSGALVQGVWVENLAENRSAIASVRHVDTAGAEYAWTGSLDGPYVIHVGCGGTPRDWAKIGYSTATTANPAVFVCDDRNPEGALPPHRIDCHYER